MIRPFLCGLLSPEGMAEGRASVVAAFEWFTHASSVDNFKCIKAKGLQLRNPGGGAEEVRHVLGDAGGNIVCLSVFPKPLWLLNKGGPSVFKVALHRDALPARLGLDSTFSGAYDKAQELKSRNPALSRAEVFLEMVMDCNIVVSYDPIPPEALRVCTTSGADPWDWPMLAVTDFRDVATFEPDIVGNVLV